MAKTEAGNFTVTATGGDTVILNDDTIDITKIVLYVSENGTTTAAGFSDGTVNFTGSNAYGDSNLTKTLTYYKNVGGTKTKILETIVTNLDLGEFSINTTTLTTSTQIKFVAYGN